MRIPGRNRQTSGKYDSYHVERVRRNNNPDVDLFPYVHIEVPLGGWTSKGFDAVTEVTLVDTVTYDTAKAVTEYTAMVQTIGGVFARDFTFPTINVANGDSIQFTYTLSIGPDGPLDPGVRRVG
jgi:hypothetical protein